MIHLPGSEHKTVLPLPLPQQQNDAEAMPSPSAETRASGMSPWLRALIVATLALVVFVVVTDLRHYVRPVNVWIDALVVCIPLAAVLAARWIRTGKVL